MKLWEESRWGSWTEYKQAIRQGLQPKPKPPEPKLHRSPWWDVGFNVILFGLFLSILAIHELGGQRAAIDAEYRAYYDKFLGNLSTTGGVSDASDNICTTNGTDIVPCPTFEHINHVHIGPVGWWERHIAAVFTNGLGLIFLIICTLVIAVKWSRWLDRHEAGPIETGVLEMARTGFLALWFILATIILVIVTRMPV